MDTIRYFRDLAKSDLRGARTSANPVFGLQQVQHQVAVDAGYRSWSALLTADETDRQIAVVMDLEPQLNQLGFGPGALAKSAQERRENFAQWRIELRASGEHVEEIRQWLERNVEPRRTINSYAGSYGLKHIVEQALGEYVANGEFIAAAIIAGYPYRREADGSPNARFGMSERSINALRNTRA